MTERYALFLCYIHEAEGGAKDLAHIGTMQECTARAEKSDYQQEAQIARMDDLAIVKTGAWGFTKHPLVAHPGTWEYQWEDLTVPA